MSKISLTKFEKFLQTNARPVDLALYNYFFQNGDAQVVSQELSKFQNEDGGFGNAIEPDLRLPQSTALGSWMAFGYINAISADLRLDVIRRGLNYFIDTYDAERNGWAIVRPEVDSYPHAPWWDYKTAMEHFGWGNPSAEILGFLIKYSDGAAPIITALKKRALERIHEVNPASFHEVFNFKGLYDLADDDLKAQLKEPLIDLIRRAVTTDSLQWTSYVATPLKFIDNPNDSFADIFGDPLIEQNLDFLINQIVDDDRWEPNWDWAGNYSEQWENARMEWSGHLTVHNLRILRNFGRV